MVSNHWLYRPNMNKSFPFRFDKYGHIQNADNNEHVREMMELILFTMPGERVNRPDFGCGVQLMVFGSTVGEVMSVKQANIQSELQRHLGHLINIQEVVISTEESRVNILIRYVLYADENQHQVIFST